jgi:acetyl esterase/lipase
MWAKQTDVPILSIDYSLAPEYKFPRQVHEYVNLTGW